MPTADQNKRRIAESIGGRIIEARDQARERGEPWTQEELAGKLGVTQETISAWQRGAAMAPLDRLVALCVILGISLYWLLQAIDPGAAPAARGSRAKRAK